MSRVELYREAVIIRSPGGTTTFVSKYPGKWRWRFVKNGRIMADSGQGYSRRIDALNGCAIVLGGWQFAGREIVRYCSHTDTIISDLRAGGGHEHIPVHDLTREAKP